MAFPRRTSIHAEESGFQRARATVRYCLDSIRWTAHQLFRGVPLLNAVAIACRIKGKHRKSMRVLIGPARKSLLPAVAWRCVERQSACA